MRGGAEVLHLKDLYCTKIVHVVARVDGHRRGRELAAIVPRSYCTREIGDRQEESAKSVGESVNVAGRGTRYGPGFLRGRSICGWARGGLTRPCYAVAVQSAGGRVMGQNWELRLSNSKATSYRVDDGPSTVTTLQPTFFPECGLMSRIR